MERKKRRLIIWTLGAIAFVAYVICAIKPLGTEYQITPTWKIDVASPTVTPATEGEKLLYFKFNRSMGYFTPEGKVTAFISYPQKATISRHFYTFYNTSNELVPFFDPAGKKLGTIGAVGFPFIKEDNIFVFLPGGGSFAKCNNDGTVAWRYESVNPITAFDANDSGIAAGFADGSIVEFNNNGRVLRAFSPGGSDYPAIHGIALSTDSSMIATVCGQNKQRFVLARNEGVNAKIIFHEFIDTVSPYQMLVSFYNNNNNVVYNSGDILAFVDVRRGKSAHIKIDNGEHAIDAQESGNCIYILTKAKRKKPDESVVDKNIANSSEVISTSDYRYTVYIVERLATLMGKFSFNANVAFIKTDENRLYIGKDSTVSCLTLEKN